MSAFLDRHSEVASVRLTKVRGSSPREAGTEMFVAPGETFGTIGGGQLEYMMIDEARMMLAKGIAHAVKDVPLGPEIGQCCGGRVEVEIARMSAADRQGALARAEAEARSPMSMSWVQVMSDVHCPGLLAQMPVRTVLVDTRAEEMALCTAPVDKRHTALPEAEITSAPDGQRLCRADPRSRARFPADRRGPGARRCGLCRDDRIGDQAGPVWHLVPRSWRRAGNPR